MDAYILGTRIGSGGFGVVYEGVRQKDGLAVAIKHLTDDEDEKSLARFIREVRCLEKLSHPNIIQILGKRLSEKPYSYVMPLYRNSLLVEIPAIVGDYGRIRHVFGAILDAMLFAHSQGVLHRDLKPENVLLSNDGSVVVNDFGLGRIISSASTRLTMTGFGMGTPFYCAPEQMADAKEAGVCSDIYSLGRILYDLFGGLGAPTIELDEVSSPIAAIIRKATRNKPDNRYQTVTSMADAFTVAMDVLLGEIGPESLEALIEQTDSSTQASSPQLAALKAALSKFVDDGEVAHEFIMTVSPEVFALLTAADNEMMRRLTRTFAKYQTSQSWGFSYTDAIGIVIETLFYAVSDGVVRANLLRAILFVGTNHNRWEVMRQFGHMLQSIENNDEASTVWAELESAEFALSHVAGYVDQHKLRPVLGKLFP